MWRMSEREPLRAIEAARLFGEQVVDLVNHLPRRAPRGLRGQLVEAAQAVSALLAEGFGRGTTGEKIHYSRMANGSIEESQNYLRQCVNTHLIHRKTFFRTWNLSVATSRMIVNLIAHLERTKDD
jgi:four helix bundle protein